MMKSVSIRLCQSVSPSRIGCLMRLGFTERQARFLVHVLVFSGVFLERQYRAFTGLAHGQKTHDFLARLVTAGYATPITPGALHRGRLFHVQYKPLYEAIGEPNNRHRRPASLGRFVERLMLLDAVLADRRYGWLGTERDKRTYFHEAFERDLPDDWYPHLSFGSGAEQTTRFFPEKLPIGVPLHGDRRHVFLYLATRAVPTNFRVFLVRLADLLRSVDEWSVRVLLPRRFRKAAALYRYAVRDAFMRPLTPREIDELDWYFRSRRGELVCPSRDPDLDLTTAARTFGAARFEALYRVWHQRGVQALWALAGGTLRDQLHRGWGRVEFAELPHQYLQLTPLVGKAGRVEKMLEPGDNLATA
ncbi:MAG: hypothetical protein DMF99_24495 [Acidobacteria bacterium]|nr:MAG: hypothetical protein DMF99_24495 [Acidobacteriota bacterium]